MTQEDSLILKLMEKMGIDKNTIVGRTEEALRKRTKVQGGQQYIGQYSMSARMVCRGMVPSW